MFVFSLPFNLGDSFEKNNIDLELLRKFEFLKLYRSRRYSEIYLFGKTFESVCYLWFMDNELINIEYRFHIENKQFFIKSINEELPANNKLDKDPFFIEHKHYVFQDNMALSLIDLDKNFFLLRVSYLPSLPRIKN